MGTATNASRLSRPDAGELLALASRLAHAAGDVLRERPADLGVTTKSSPTDVVTVMDRAAERVIIDGLGVERPDDAILSEESPASAGETGVRWIIDPLDGTVNYLYRIPQYAVSIAVEVDGEVVAGVVRQVEHEVEYSAVLGQGATRDGVPLTCSAQHDPALSLVATGFNYELPLRTRQAGSIATILTRVRDIRRFGAASLDLCAVASGQVDAYFEAGMYEWDWAAGALIAREAGARVDGLSGLPPGRATTLAANPVLFGRLHDVLVSVES